MTEMLFDIFITGKLVNGVSPDEAQQNFANLFKTTSDKVSRYFSGQPQLFKRAINKTEALRYKEALHKAGVLVSFMAHKPAAAASDPASAAASPEQPSSTVTTRAAASAGEEHAQSSQEDDRAAALTLAPVGSDVLNKDERHEFVAADVDTSNIKMVSAFLDVEPVAKDTPPAPDTGHLSIAAAGVDLLDDKPDAPAPLDLDLDSLSLAPAGSLLDEIHDDLPPVNPDISALSIAPPGADILEGETKAAPPPAPDTSHISL